ncbi:Dyp-type peroxidase [Pseudomonas sp. P66]|jgi:putative iron-dependent peroxidase|uniref:Dyp-type peroxidase n=1 Tax=Pseudomonas arcuscaelestis TaxID=2710591 RepID=A0ABS2BSQ9_9PSED|nr:Dyp-type peroxidase [Pseudomonas arcuscaelestis]MBM3104021.1 Dyp-type peroxidase [Pseudomonas arcuscaelestis]MBM3112367.1 Dyp-type peroxidase [Pseudomonas arcuscaelestis]MBM5456485.1 Dyp-type peroxidase [Pseudomonas arcuscaelestis]
MQFQPGILAAPVPAQARHLFFTLHTPAALAGALDALQQHVDGSRVVAGFGAPLVQALGRSIEGLRAFPQLTAAVDNPCTQHDLWLWVRGEDRGELWLLSQALEKLLAPALTLVEATDAFRHKSGFDLTGYEDGTENPVEDAAVDAAILATDIAGMSGSSFAAFQLWRHDLDCFKALPQAEQDDIIGRRKADNEELEEAPESAHVKRTAQESFDPEAFIVRRSMPWADERGAGLAFLAFGHSFDAFEVQLRRMSGLEDGVVDALYRFSRPLTGGYYWCPPLAAHGLDLSALLS